MLTQPQLYRPRSSLVPPSDRSYQLRSFSTLANFGRIPKNNTKSRHPSTRVSVTGRYLQTPDIQNAGAQWEGGYNDVPHVMSITPIHPRQTELLCHSSNGPTWSMPWSDHPSASL